MMGGEMRVFLRRGQRAWTQHRRYVLPAASVEPGALQQSQWRWRWRGGGGDGNGRAASLMGAGFAAALAVGMGSIAEAEEETTAVAAPGKWKQSISTNWVKYKVIGVYDVSHDTKVFRFKLPAGECYNTIPTDTLQVGFFDWTHGERITRHYTPVSPNGTQGYFELMVKLYPRGLITPQMWKVKVGDDVDIRRQASKFHYQANKWKTFNMIAGGVGITPMLQIIRTALSDAEDNTKLNLVFCNKSQRDILLKEELDDLQSSYPGRFRVTYVIDRPEAGWSGPVGHLNTQAIKALLPRPDGRKHFLAMCGPDGMLINVGGVPRGHLSSWSHVSGVSGRQPSFPDANSTASIGGKLAEAGWSLTNTYIF